MRYLKMGLGGAVAAVLVAPSALAGFTALPRQQVGNLVGARSADTASCSVSTHTTERACDAAGEEWTVSTSDPTGIFEIVANQEILIVAIVTMVMATAAFMLFRTWLRRGQG